MASFYIASFNRASDGALSKLSQFLDQRGMLVESEPRIADYILAPGDRKETFEFCLKWYGKIPIIHLWAGEVSQGTHDEVSTTEVLPLDLKEKTRQIMRTELKGKTEQLDIFRVIWEEDDLECTGVGIPAFRKPQECAYELTLNYRANTIKINEQCKSAILGRDDACDITARTEFASRQHARIDYRYGKLVISDQSTNGTYLRFSDGHMVHLTREDIVLRGSGTISLGQSYSESPTELIEFTVNAIPAA